MASSRRTLTRSGPGPTTSHVPPERTTFHGLPHFAGRLTTLVWAGFRQPLVRLSWIRCGVTGPHLPAKSGVVVRLACSGTTGRGVGCPGRWRTGIVGLGRWCIGIVSRSSGAGAFAFASVLVGHFDVQAHHTPGRCVRCGSFRGWLAVANPAEAQLATSVRQRRQRRPGRGGDGKGFGVHRGFTRSVDLCCIYGCA
jgi:hypothetical protein